MGWSRALLVEKGTARAAAVSTSDRAQQLPSRSPPRAVGLHTPLVVQQDAPLHPLSEEDRYSGVGWPGATGHACLKQNKDGHTEENRERRCQTG